MWVGGGGVASIFALLAKQGLNSKFLEFSSVTGVHEIIFFSTQILCTTGNCTNTFKRQSYMQKELYNRDITGGRQNLFEQV